VLVISTDNYTPFQYIGYFKCTVSVELVQTCSEHHNLKPVSNIFWTRKERQPEIYSLCALGLGAVLQAVTIKDNTLGKVTSVPAINDIFSWT